MTLCEYCDLRSDSRPIRSCAHKWAFHDGLGGYVYTMETKQVHAVNSCARLILGLCDGVNTIHDIAAAVRHEYGIGLEEALADVDAFVKHCLEEGFLCLS